MLSLCRKACASSTRVAKGKVVLRLPDENRYRVKIELNNIESATITARMHENCPPNTILSMNSPVFVYEDTDEIVAFGDLKTTDNKIVFRKYACIHLERGEEKLCKNCPKRQSN
jgi:hypothetical protein